MKIGEQAFAIVGQNSKMEVMPCLITGVRETLKKTTFDGITKRDIHKEYDVESLDGIYEATITSENLFSDKEKAEEQLNAIMGMDKKKIEQREYDKAKSELNSLKRYLKRKNYKYNWNDEIEDTIIKLIKDGFIYTDFPFSEANKLIDRHNARGLFYFDPFDSFEQRQDNFTKRLERLMEF